MYSNYIFDLYGTLADIHTNEQKAYLWKKLACFLSLKGASYTPQELRSTFYQLLEQAVEQQTSALLSNRSAKEDINRIHPEPDIAPVFEHIFTQKGITASEDEIQDFAVMWRSISLEKLHLFDGVLELLQRLKAAGKGVYLLSNAQALFTRPELNYLGITGYFDGILLSSEAGVKKPDPAFFHMLLSKYHLKPEESIMTGNDDIADCHGAAAAGLDSLYIYTEQSPKRTRPLPVNCREITHMSQVFPA